MVNLKKGGFATFSYILFLGIEYLFSYIYLLGTTGSADYPSIAFCDKMKTDKIKTEEETMIAIGSDHAAYEFKMAILNYLVEKGYECKDFGSDGNVRSDYPHYAKIVGKAIQSGECDRGLLFCGTGIGMSIAANKMKGIRAVVCMEAFGAELSRKHNNANVLCLGARVLGLGLAQRIIDVWLETGFDGGRHQTRVDMITEMENQEGCE